MKVPKSDPLLNLNRSASFLQAILNIFGLVFADTFLNRLGRFVDHSLGLFQAQAGNFTHDFDDRGVVKRFNVMLEDQLVIDLERTDEVISY